MIFDIGKKIKEFDESGIRQLIYADRVTKRNLIQSHISYITYDFELGDVTNIVYKVQWLISDRYYAFVFELFMIYNSVVH